MIKLLTLLARRSDFTHAQFVQIWADETPALITGVDLSWRYVQYRLHPDRVWPPGTPQLDLQLDGIEELWLEGPPQRAGEILGRVRTPAYLQHLRSHVGAMATSYSTNNGSPTRCPRMRPATGCSNGSCRS